jgi:hypothetical protein
MTRRSLLAALASAAGSSRCGYRVGGKADLLPATVQTIYIGAFGNNTTRYRLTGRLPGAIASEFIARTRYRVVTDAGQADAVFEGTVLNVLASPTIFDTATGRAAGIQVSVFLDLKLTERATGRLLYNRAGYEARSRYEVSTDERQYFDESDAALERVCGEVARTVVSSILEAF